MACSSAFFAAAAVSTANQGVHWVNEDVAAAIVTQTLSPSPTLPNLNPFLSCTFSHNEFRSDGARVLYSALTALTNLQWIDLR